MSNQKAALDHDPGHIFVLAPWRGEVRVRRLAGLIAL